MCGFAGLIAADGAEPALLRRMARSIAHRGPDDEGFWADGAVGLASRRLAIVDLSPNGHQPMASADGRWVIAYNGEIYNHPALRAELETAGAVPQGGWCGHSDTETMVQAIAAWGLVPALERMVGMFAFALWDARTRELRLVRDRFGEKPLYYGWAGRDFLFGSELKALRQHPRFDGAIDRDALDQYAARNYIPAPRSIYRGVFKLEPGCILTIDETGARQPWSSAPRAGDSSGGLGIVRYWSYRDIVGEGLRDPIADEGEALDALGESLGAAVRGQSVADVTVGAFLSGGIDSSTIVALYQKYSSNPVRTFSIGFEEAGYNEAVHARAVAAHFGTVHHEHYVTASEAREVIPLLPAMYDEPFADPSQIPTYLVSRFARDKVTVALTGDGGDELFAGYNRHFLAPRLWKHLARVPRPLRIVAGASLSHLPSSLWSAALRVSGNGTTGLGDKLRRALRIAASARGFDDVCRDFLDEWHGEDSPVLGSDIAPEFDLDAGGGASDAERMMYCDAISYLPDDILCKVDRASMAVSLETRVPFLDHRVAAVAARIPIGLKLRGGQGKHILRELLYREAPPALFDRPKAGFGVPVGEWIRGPLRPWAEELLDPRRMAEEGFLDPAIVQRRWREHLGGRRHSSQALWAILMFQAWLREQASSVALAA